MLAKALAVVVILVLVSTFALYSTKNVATDGSSVGAAGPDFLRSAPYASILIEIDYQTGASPSPVAVRNFVDFVEEVTNKSVSVELKEIPGSPEQGNGMYLNSSQTYYSMDQVQQIYNNDPKTFAMPTVLVLHVLYYDLQFQDKTTLGMALGATAIAMFGPTLQNETTVNGEAVVLTQNFLHILGLCALTYPDVGHHCANGFSTNPGDVLYKQFNLANSDVVALRMDAKDWADINAIRDGTFQ